MARVDDDQYNSKGESFKKTLDKKYGKTKNVPSMVGRTWDKTVNGLNNFRQDATANNNNFMSFLTGLGKQDSTPESIRDGFGNFRPGGMNGDSFRSRPTPKPLNADQATRKQDPRGVKDRQEPLMQRNINRLMEGPPVAEAEEEAEMSFADYLRIARGMMDESSSPGTDYSALEGQLRNNASQGDARLEAMFRQLGGSIAADAPVIQQAYTDAGASMKTSADEAAASSNAGYDSARAGQSEQLRALGIEQAAGTIASKGTGSTQEQGRTNENIQEGLAAGQTLNTQKMTSSLDFNRGVGNAAQLAGATQRAGLQQQLAQKLAELQVAQSEENSSRSMRNDDQAWSRAGMLADWDNDAAQRRQGPSAKDELDMALLAGQVEGQSLKNENARYTLDNPSGSEEPAAYGANLPMIQAIAKQMKLDPMNPRDLQTVVDMFGN